MDRDDWQKVMQAAEESAAVLDRLAGTVDFTGSVEDRALFLKTRELVGSSMRLYWNAQAQSRR